MLNCKIKMINNRWKFLQLKVTTELKHKPKGRNIRNLTQEILKEIYPSIKNMPHNQHTLKNKMNPFKNLSQKLSTSPRTWRKETSRIWARPLPSWKNSILSSIGIPELSMFVFSKWEELFSRWLHLNYTSVGMNLTTFTSFCSEKLK